jgi:hypothetical protein
MSDRRNIHAVCGALNRHGRAASAVGAQGRNCQLVQQLQRLGARILTAVTPEPTRAAIIALDKRGMETASCALEPSP